MIQKKQINCRIEQGLEKHLSQLANSLGKTKTQLIDEAIRDYLDYSVNNISVNNISVDSSWKERVKEQLKPIREYSSGKAHVKGRKNHPNFRKLNDASIEFIVNYGADLSHKLKTFLENNKNYTETQRDSGINIDDKIIRLKQGHGIRDDKITENTDYSSETISFYTLLNDFVKSEKKPDLVWFDYSEDNTEKFTVFLMIDDGGGFQSALVKNIYTESKNIKRYCKLVECKDGDDDAYFFELEKFLTSDAQFLVTVDISAASYRGQKVTPRAFLRRFIDHGKTVIFLESGGQFLEQWKEDIEKNILEKTTIPPIYSINTDHRSLIQLFEYTVDFISKNNFDRIGFFSVLPNIPLISDKISAYQWFFKELHNASHVHTFDYSACQSGYPGSKDPILDQSNTKSLENIANTLTCVAKHIVGLCPVWTESFKPDLDEVIQDEQKIFLKRLLSSEESTLAVIFCANDEIALRLWEFLKILMQPITEDHWQRHLLLTGCDGINAFTTICDTHECAVTISAPFVDMRDTIDDIVNRKKLDQREIIYLSPDKVM